MKRHEETFASPVRACQGHEGERIAVERLGLLNRREDRSVALDELPRLVVPAPIKSKNREGLADSLTLELALSTMAINSGQSQGQPELHLGPIALAHTL